MARLYHDDNYQRGDHQRKRNKRNQRNAPSTGRKLAPYNPVLRFKVPMEPHEQHHNANSQERRTEGLAHLPQMLVRTTAPTDSRGSIKPEQLRDSNANRSKGERSSQPSKESTFCI